MPLFSTSSFLRNCSVALSLAAVSACGGGGSSNGVTAPTTGSQEPPAVTSQASQGTITGFGSVFANGVEWETDDCEISIDDQPGDESQLEVGDIVEIHGTMNSDGTANCETMEFDPEIEGTIDEIGADYLVVLGMRIEVDADTIVDDELPSQDLTGLSVGQKVEVSAFRVDDHYIASRIDVEVDDGEVETYGEVRALDSSNNTFTINNLVVDYSTATFEDFGGMDIADGELVEVAGMSFDANGALIAQRIELEDNNPYDDGEEGGEFEIEGYLAVGEEGALSINGTPFVLAGEPTFKNGTAEDLVSDVKVEVEGHLNAQGILEVEDVSFRLASEIEIKAPLDITPVDATFVSVLGLSIQIGETTQLNDASETDETYFEFTDLVEGDWVELKIAIDNDGVYVATRLEHEDPQDTVTIEAGIEAIDGDTITLVSLPILLTAETALPDGFADLEALIVSLSIGTDVEIDGFATVRADGQLEISATAISIDD